MKLGLFRTSRSEVSKPHPNLNLLGKYYTSTLSYEASGIIGTTTGQFETYWEKVQKL